MVYFFHFIQVVLNRNSINYMILTTKINRFSIHDTVYDLTTVQVHSSSLVKVSAVEGSLGQNATLVIWGKL